eukprot:2660430-Prymnesium_polylepis.1
MIGGIVANNSSGMCCGVKQNTCAVQGSGPSLFIGAPVPAPSATPSWSRRGRVRRSRRGRVRRSRRGRLPWSRRARPFAVVPARPFAVVPAWPLALFPARPPTAHTPTRMPARALALARSHAFVTRIARRRRI